MFVEPYLADLRREGFTPRAVARYVSRCAVRSAEAAWTRPRALRSVGLAGLGHLVGLLLIAVAVSLRVDRALGVEYFIVSSWWLLGGLAWITLHLGMFREDKELFVSGLGLPNFLTLGRLLTIPAFYLFLTRGHEGLALAAFLAGGLSDVADGMAARKLHASTKMGRIFDPIVDVLFNGAVAFALTRAGYLPMWILVLVGIRYGLLMLGAAWIYVTRGPVAIRPTVLGKTTGVITTGLVLAVVVVYHFFPGAAAEQVLELLYAAIGFVLLLTTLQVITIGIYNLRYAGHVPVARGAMAVILGKRATGEDPVPEGDPGAEDEATGFSSPSETEGNETGAGRERREGESGP